MGPLDGSVTDAPRGRVGNKALQTLQTPPRPPTTDQVALVVALGVANVIGVGTLASLLNDPYSSAALAANGLLWIGGLLPVLKLYAASFFAIPSFRWGSRR